MTIDPAVVIAAIGALATGLGWVARRVYTDLRSDIAELSKDRDDWREAALKSMGITDKAIVVAEKKADGA